MSNEIKLTINISDQLLVKLMHIMQQPQANSMGIPLQALMAMQQPQSKEPPKEKEPIGFKA